MNRYRLSTLVFDDAGRLWRAIADLLDKGLDPAQLCLAGQLRTLNDLEVPQELPQDVREKLTRLLNWKDLPLRLDGASDLVARGSERMTDLLNPTGASVGSFDWMQDERSRELARETQSRGVILLVSATSADQLAMSAGILLRHGRHSLQTHVFARRNPH